MNTQPTPQPVVRYLVRHYVELLTLLTLLFVLQTGLVPFDFGSSTEGGRFFTSGVTDFTFSDVVSNIFLYFPLGVLVHWSLCRVARGSKLVVLATVIVAAGLSVTVESIQAYSPTRVSSLIDLVSNVIGASLGAGVSSVARSILPRLMGVALVEFHERPFPAILKSYCILLLVLATIPFSFSLDRVRLKQSVQAAVLVPFAPLPAGAPFGFAAAGPDLADYARWERMKRCSRWVAECASFAALAWGLQIVLSGHYGFGRFGVLMLTGWIGGAFAVFLSLLQLPIVSRACDVTDIVFRVLGLVIGLLSRSLYLRGTGTLSECQHARLRRSFSSCVCAVVVVYIFCSGLMPFTFSADWSGPARSIRADGFLPFFAYFTARFDIMMGDVLEKFLSYVIMAGLLASCWERVRHSDTRSRLMMVTSVGLFVSIAIEVAQMFISVRVASLTDPILAVAGCVVGVLGQQQAAMFCRFAVSKAIPGGSTDPPAMRSAKHTPTDALIATLFDPAADAPVEIVPKPSLQPKVD